MFSDGEGLGEVISEVGNASAPGDEKLPLGYTVLNPVKTHVDGFAMLLLDAVLCNPNCATVVAQDDGRGLRVPEIFQDGAQLGTMLGVHE